MTADTDLAFAAFCGGLGMCFSMLCTWEQNEDLQTETIITEVGGGAGSVWMLLSSGPS